MVMYERVLVPLDGSRLVEAILPFAEKIAGPLDAEILLVRVVEPIPGAVALASGETGSAEALLHDQMAAKWYLSDLAERLGQRGLRVRTFAPLGVPATEIVAVAEAEKADLVAMTTHGRSGLGRVVFGSVAEAVLRAASVPVLMFKVPAKATAPTVEVERR
ncbi:MAG: universal stress protein [Candidatus Rokubacteria bacterium]|nr:universal stress protein [Candidatus Rokubacteria bacterium]